MSAEHQDVMDDDDQGEGESNDQNETETEGSEKRARRPEIVETSVSGSVVTYKFTNDEIVTIDVLKLPAATQAHYAVEGVRNAGRLSFQKLDDPVQAAKTLRDKIERMVKGETGGHGRVTKHQPTALTQALANITGKSVQFIEDTWYPRYFASEDSGCTRVTVKGKERIYGKTQALDKLSVDPGVKVELDKVMRERQAKVAKLPANKKVDISGLIADAPTAA